MELQRIIVFGSKNTYYHQEEVHSTLKMQKYGDDIMYVDVKMFIVKKNAGKPVGVPVK